MMTGIVTGVAVGAVLIAVNAVISALAGMKKRSRRETESINENAQRIQALEKETAETKEITKLTLGTCIIIGDGMVQNGLNGDFKREFCKKKQDALKML